MNQNLNGIKETRNKRTTAVTSHVELKAGPIAGFFIPKGVFNSWLIPIETCISYPF